MVRFIETPLLGAYVIELEPHHDTRGYFARAFCAEEFNDRGLAPVFVQCNMSFNHKAGTLRGMHMQIQPAPEAKLFRCISGAVYDVIVDMRPNSRTYMQHFGVELSAENRRALYIPEHFAAGYQTLTDNTEMFYQVTGFYTPECERGFRHDDPAFAIAWPLPVSVISEKDSRWPLLPRTPIGAES